MTNAPEWWTRPRRVDVLVDNPSWILPHAEALVASSIERGDRARLIRNHDEAAGGDVLFLLGCLHLLASDRRARYWRCLVIHESDLPKGRGFSPLTWLTLEGENNIPVCLLDAADEADAGPVVFKDFLSFTGAELIDEMRVAQGKKTTELALRFLDAPYPPEGVPQIGPATTYSRRTQADSQLDPALSLSEQFELLRVVDNERYPAFFDFRGRRYVLKIEPDDR